MQYQYIKHNATHIYCLLVLQTLHQPPQVLLQMLIDVIQKQKWFSTV